MGQLRPFVKDGFGGEATNRLAYKDAQGCGVKWISFANEYYNGCVVVWGLGLGGLDALALFNAVAGIEDDRISLLEAIDDLDFSPARFACLD